MRSPLLAAPLLWLGCALSPLQGQVDLSAVDLTLIDRRDHPLDGCLVISGLPRDLVSALIGLEARAGEWFAVLAVYLGDELPGDLPAMLGDYRLEDGQLVFKPRFPFKRGRNHIVRLSWPGGKGEQGALRVFRFRPQDNPAGEVTRVTGIDPGGAEAPANLLRVYVHFSAPMRPGATFDYIRLLTADGTQVETPFLAMDQELWDRGRRRFTLFFHPGRIKRGVGGNTRMGLPLEEGNDYRLVVGRELRDAAGRPLDADFEWRFRAGPADRQSPEVGHWRLQLPAAGSRQPLRIQFDEPLDRPLAERLIAVQYATGESLAGEVRVGEAGAVWALTPAAPWRSGEYRLVVDHRLEDRAGNRLDRLFDRIFKPDADTEKRPAPAKSERPFRIRSQIPSREPGIKAEKPQ